ncbi:hypothetical protein EDEG_03247 [Edhazardia aedis USNM 41457]|uniref:Coatomer subunit delta n=1 Tax=Edhazardia aedis (strain USNM 41457) TaxID=1003232 RepID=J9D435_EDHAE|nr:hypothetical protein EDEG_03247 [Edhazardia aedis USNM 41457]|eukprot:EJW02314.1 hypothetical protein EDEG_03247 [Edhazardia aedis USNM 41457]
MIAAFVSYNKDLNNTLIRPYTNLDRVFQESILKTLKTSVPSKLEDNVIKVDKYDFCYIAKGRNIHGVLSSNLAISECFYILNHLKSILSDDFFNNLLVANSIFRFVDLKEDFSKNLETLGSSIVQQSENDLSKIDANGNRKNEKTEFSSLQEDESSSDCDIFYKNTKSTTAAVINYDLIPVDDLFRMLKGETREEQIYENMMRNKELETDKKKAAFKSGKKDNIEQHLEKVRNLELEMRNMQLKQIEELKELEKRKATINTQSLVASSASSLTKKRAQRKTQIDPTKMEGNFIVTIKEKLNAVIDKDNIVKESYVNGDLSVLVKDEAYRQHEIMFKKLKKCDIKFSPNIDKEKSNENILYCKKGFPLNKNVALMKWKRKIPLPLSFSIWVSDEDDKQVVQFEIEPDIRMNDLVISFQNNCISCENKELKTAVKNGLLEWSVDVNSDGQIEQGSIEIVCERYEDIFPIFVDFWTDETQMAVDIGKNDEIKVLKVLEAEKVEITYSQ